MLFMKIFAPERNAEQTVSSVEQPAPGSPMARFWSLVLGMRHGSVYGLYTVRNFPLLQTTNDSIIYFSAFPFFFFTFFSILLIVSKYAFSTGVSVNT